MAYFNGTTWVSSTPAKSTLSTKTTKTVGSVGSTPTTNTSYSNKYGTTTYVTPTVSKTNNASTGSSGSSNSSSKVDNSGTSSSGNSSGGSSNSIKSFISSVLSNIKDNSSGGYTNMLGVSVPQSVSDSVKNNYGLSDYEKYLRDRTSSLDEELKTNSDSEVEDDEPASYNPSSSGGSDGGSSSSSSSQDSILEYLRSLSDDTLNAIISSIMAQLEATKKSYENQEDEINKSADDEINQSEVERYKARKAMRTSLANKGQLDSGLGRFETLYNDVNSGNRVATINANREQALNEIKNYILQAEAQANSDVASAKNNIASQMINLASLDL